MAVKTSDFTVKLDEFTTEGFAIDAKKKTAIRINGLDTENVKDLDMKIVGDNLEISYDGKKLLVSNYTSLKYIKTEYEKVGKKEYYDLFNIIDNNAVTNTNPITYNAKKLTVSGTNYNDNINLSLSDYTPVGTKNIKANKGITFDGKHGSDILIGTGYNDVFKGGNGNDNITGGAGNDTITGGTGKNIINYTFEAGKSIGNDVINLTKGENFLININGDTEHIDFKFLFENKNKDLKIYISENESITLKNFVSKDVTNNSNSKKSIEDTSSVELKIAGETYDLRNFVIDNINNFPLYTVETEKNYSGSWLGEYISGGIHTHYLDKEKTQIDTNYSKKGITIDGKNGNDYIDGSNYSDIIKGGNGNDTIEGYRGNDTITGGTGANKILIFKENGNDIINLTKGEQLTISLEEETNIQNIKFEIVKNDLRIYHNSSDENNYLTIKNFVKKDVTNNSNAKKGIEDTSSVMLEIDGKTYDLRKHFYGVDVEKNYTGSWLNEQIIAEKYTRFTDKKKTIVDTDVTKKGLSLNGKDGNDLIAGSNYSDTIKGGNGNDTLFGYYGNDKLYGEAGKNTFVFEVGHGKDTIYSGKGEDTVIFDDVDYINSIEQVKKGSKDAIISYGDKGDTVTIKDFYTIDKKGNITGTNSSVKCIKTDYQQICVSSKADDVFELTEYGDGFEDRLHTTILAGANSSDALVLNDELFAGNDGNFYFVKEGNDFKIWYNYDTSISTASVPPRVSTYNGSEINNIGGLVYTSSITIKDYFTAENPIDKFIINGTEYSIYDNYTNKIDLDDFNFENDTSNEVYGTKWNDEIWSRSSSSSVNGDTIYAGEGDDKIISGGSWLNSFYGENGDDEIIIGANGVLADGGAGNDTITHRESGTINPNGTRIIGGIGNDELQGSSYPGIKSIFEFKMGDGQDTVVSKSEIDIIKITDCEHSAITYEKDGDNILIKYGESDVITVKDALKNLAKIMVEDQTGTPINLFEQLNIFVGDSIVSGNDDNNIIYGRDANDTIIGKKGDDLLVGNKGSDTFVFNTGDGIDTIVNGNNTELDSIKFNDITDVRNLEFNIADNEKDLVISYGDNDKVIVQNYFEYGNTVTTWVDKGGNEHAIATDNNHSINDTYSASITGTIFNDYITVNALNKSIAGGEGANTYVITADNVAHSITTTSGRDTIKFDTEISNLTFDVNGNDVTIKGEKIDVTIKNYLVDLLSLNITDSTNTTSKLIENLVSAGYIYSDEENIIGTDNSENIFGGDSANIIQSKKGNDLINGGLGNDTFVFYKGDGTDSIVNGTVTGEVDTLKFADSTLDELTYTVNGSDLVIRYSNSEYDTVTVKNYFTDGNTVKKFKVFDNVLSDYVEYDIEKDLKNNIHATSTTVSGTEKNDRIWGTAGEDTISDDKGFNEFIGGNGADTYLINGYGEGIADTVHNTIVMGTDNVVDTIKLVDNNFYGNSGNFQFDKVGDDLRIWYNYDTDIVEDASFIRGVNKYNGTEIYYTGGAYAYCSSLTIKDYFKSTAENCTIDKFVLVNKEGERQFSILENYQGTFYLDDMNYESSSSNTFYGTRWNDSISSRSGGSSVDGDTVYAGDGNDIIINGGSWKDSFYGENGNDEIFIGCRGVLADGGAGDDKITHNRSGSYSLDGTILRGGTGNDTLTSHYDSNVTSIFEFKTGDGNDIINYKGNTSIIKFTDVEITDITFGEYDLENQMLTLSYGTSDSITINGLTPQNNLVKIQDSTGEKYTIYVGYGDYYTTTQKPLIDGENAILIGSTGREHFDGGSDTNIFVSLDYYDTASGHSEGKNIYITTPEENTTIYPYGANNKIIIKDLELSQLNYELDLNSDGNIKITNTVNSQVIALKNYTSIKENITIVAKDGETTLLDELPIKFPEGETLQGNEGTDGNDILIGSGINDKVDTIVGGKGDDILFGDEGPDIYVFNKGDGNDVLGKYSGDDATLRFNNSTYEELSFKQLSGDKYQVTYNDGADSVIFYTDNDNVTKFIVKDDTVEGGYKEYSIATDMQQYIKGNGVETDLMGSDIKDIFTGTAENETMTGGKGSNIYNFTTGGGTDTVVITSTSDTINFTDVETGKLTFDINGEDLVIKYSETDKVIIKDYVTELQPITITGANSTSTTALEGFGETGAQIVNKTTAEGKETDDYIICTDIDNDITGGKGNDTLSGAGGNNTYIFNKGDGSDTIGYTNGNDIIKFNDVEEITDITFGEYDLENKTFTMSYGTSDQITVNGLTPQVHTLKIEDKNGTQYTVYLGYGDNTTKQQAKDGENAIFIGSTGRDDFRGNSGINVFANGGFGDSSMASPYGTNIFLIPPEKSQSIYSKGQNDKIIFKDLELSDLVCTYTTDGGGIVEITNTKNSQVIRLLNFLGNSKDQIIVDKNGDTTTVCEEAGFICGDVGTTKDDILYSTTANAEVYGKGGNDLIYAGSNSIIYTYDKDLKNTTAGSTVTVKAGSATIYAQSEENIINISGNSTCYAYSDQKTSITESSAQANTVLNIKNTNDVSDIDGVHTNLNIVFNVSKDYKTTQGIYAIGDVRILDDNNFDNWVKGASYKDNVTIVGNCVETINSSDGYSITSEQIAQLAENVASWLTTNEFANVNAAMSGGTTQQIEELTAYFTNASNWTATV